MDTGRYLTRIRSTSHPVADEERRNAVALYKRLMALFPDDLTDASGGGHRRAAGLLWRHDHTTEGHTIIAVSRIKPDLASLPNWWGRGRTIDYTPLLDRLRDGDHYQCRIVANPLADHTRGRKHTRVPITDPDDLTAWWQRTADRIGVEPTTTTITTMAPDISPKEGHVVTTHRVRIEDTITVADTDRLRSALTDGVGRAKPYGCGLLTLAPAPWPVPRAAGVKRCP